MNRKKAVAPHAMMQPSRKRDATQLDGVAAQPAMTAAPTQHADPAELPLDSDDSAAIVPEDVDVVDSGETGSKQRDPAVVLDEMLQALLQKLSLPHRRYLEHVLTCLAQQG